jgi:hypothetical protein
MSSSSVAPAKEKKFGVRVCRERKCTDLQKDPKWPDSPQQCQITHGMPGAMHCCIKEMDAEHFIRQVSGQLNNSPYSAQRPGVRNCPKECPYKILVDGTKFVFMKGKPQSSRVPAKIGTCAFTGKPLGECGVCPCNVLGNENQEQQIELLRQNIDLRLRDSWKCADSICPDGKDRRESGRNGDFCPVIRMPMDELKECPLWRIPTKTLAKPDTKVSTVESSRPEKVAQKDKLTSRKLARKDKTESRQLTFADFGPGVHIFRDRAGSITGITTHPAKKSKEPKDPRCTDCRSSGECATHNPDEEECVAASMVKPAKKSMTKKKKGVKTDDEN